MDIRLPLDGIYQFRLTIRDHGYSFRRSVGVEQVKNVNWLKRHVWLRLMLPIHLALVIIRTCVFQLLRGVASLLSGVLTLDRKRIVFGAKDFIATIVQVIVLPVFTIISIAWPLLGYEYLYHFEKRFDIPFRNEVGKIPEEQPQSLRAVRREISGIARGILGVPMGIVDGLTMTVSGALSANEDKITDGFRYFFRGFTSFFLGFGAGCGEDCYDKVLTVHRLFAIHAESEASDEGMGPLVSSQKFTVQTSAL